jgi:hypothetical protein
LLGWPTCSSAWALALVDLGPPNGAKAMDDVRAEFGPVGAVGATIY